MIKWIKTSEKLPLEKTLVIGYYKLDKEDSLLYSFLNLDYKLMILHWEYATPLSYRITRPETKTVMWVMDNKWTGVIKQRELTRPPDYWAEISNIPNCEEVISPIDNKNNRFSMMDVE